MIMPETPGRLNTTVTSASCEWQPGRSLIFREQNHLLPVIVVISRGTTRQEPKVTSGLVNAGMSNKKEWNPLNKMPGTIKIPYIR